MPDDPVFAAPEMYRKVRQDRESGLRVGPFELRGRPSRQAGNDSRVDIGVHAKGAVAEGSHPPSRFEEEVKHCEELPLRSRSAAKLLQVIDHEQVDSRAAIPECLAK